MLQVQSLMNTYENHLLSLMSTATNVVLVDNRIAMIKGNFRVNFQHLLR